MDDFQVAEQYHYQKKKKKTGKLGEKRRKKGKGGKKLPETAPKNPQPNRPLALDSLSDVKKEQKG